MNAYEKKPWLAQYSPGVPATAASTAWKLVALQSFHQVTPSISATRAYAASDGQVLVHVAYFRGQNADTKLAEARGTVADRAKGLIEAGLHPATGGPGTQACSGDMLLEALVACAGVTMEKPAVNKNGHPGESRDPCLLWH